MDGFLIGARFRPVSKSLLNPKKWPIWSAFIIMYKLMSRLSTSSLLAVIFSAYAILSFCQSLSSESELVSSKFDDSLIFS